MLKRLNDKIKIYKDKHKKQLLLPNPKSEDPDTLTWDLSDATQRKNFLSIRDNLWIEGYAVSKNSGDTGLQLTYRPIKPLSGGVLQDIIDTMKMTVVKVELIVTGHDFKNPKSEMGIIVAEEKEYKEGVYIHFNIDNDALNTSNLPDYKNNGPINNEDDLKKVIINYQPIDLSVGEIILKCNNLGIQLWTSRIKGTKNKLFVGQEISWQLNNKTTKEKLDKIKNSLYAEGSYCGDAELKVILKYGNINIYSDIVKYHIIAAICGKRPSLQQRKIFEEIFPELVHCEWSITGKKTLLYNCIAWTVGETTTWYNPPEIDLYYGDADGVFETSDMDAFYEKKLGLEPNATGPEDAKVIYYSYSKDWNYLIGDPPPSKGYHGAKKKLDCNCCPEKWIMFESKCGGLERIEHIWNQLNGSVYGYPSRFYK